MYARDGKRHRLRWDGLMDALIAQHVSGKHQKSCWQRGCRSHTIELCTKKV
jgi:hypothetical protein